MKIGVFTLPQALLEKDPNIVINNAYPFKDGELRVLEPVAKQIQNILVHCYECSVEYVAVDEAEKPVSDETSLAKHVTKGAPTLSQSAADHVSQPKRDPEAVKSVFEPTVGDGVNAAKAVSEQAAKAAPEQAAK